MRRLFILEDGSAYGARTRAQRCARRAETRGQNRRPGDLADDREDLRGARLQDQENPRRRRLHCRHDRRERGSPPRGVTGTLGAGEKILGPDGFTPFPALLEAGRAAEGVTVSVAESPTGRLDKTGTRFATSFAAAVGASTEPYSVAAAQATDDLVAAIAHSNGTRESVIAELHALPTIGGILGDFRFDRNGDTTAGVVTIYRIHHGRPVIWRIIRPPSK